MMAAQQLHLFDPAKPLLQRFGAEFFRAVPPKPGVYIMGGDRERVLYIGQSKNLRNRLGSYKNARPDRVPRKIIRLVHSVRTIVWEECETAEAARLKENQLLRVHRPKFNVMNTYPQGYGFVTLQADAGQFSLGIGTEPKSGEKIYGAFKSGCVRAYGSLLRLVWAAFHQPASPYDFPTPLLGSRPPRQYLFQFSRNTSGQTPDVWVKSVEEFLAGTSNELIQLLTEAVPAAETVSPFQQNLQLKDLEIIGSFFEHGPKRNRDLRDRHGITSPIIPQEELDDLLVVAKIETAAQEKEPEATFI
jgi:excinuclease UvrABC nuclease subunit